MVLRRRLRTTSSTDIDAALTDQLLLGSALGDPELLDHMVGGVACRVRAAARRAATTAVRQCCWWTCSTDAPGA